MGESFVLLDTIDTDTAIGFGQDSIRQRGASKAFLITKAFMCGTLVRQLIE